MNIFDDTARTGKGTENNVTTNRDARVEESYERFSWNINEGSI